MILANFSQCVMNLSVSGSLNRVMSASELEPPFSCGKTCRRGVLIFSLGRRASRFPHAPDDDALVRFSSSPRSASRRPLLLLILTAQRRLRRRMNCLSSPPQNQLKNVGNIHRVCCDLFDLFETSLKLRDGGGKSKVVCEEKRKEGKQG